MRISAFTPALSGMLYQRVGFTVDGTPNFGSGSEIRYSPVTLRQNIEPTSIRTDKAASKSRADESTLDARILVSQRSVVEPDNELKLQDGLRYRAVGVFPRHDMNGDLDHYQVDLVKA